MKAPRLTVILDDAFAAAIEAADPDFPLQPKHEVLFELLLFSFENLHPHKAELQDLLKSSLRHPRQLKALKDHLAGGLRWILHQTGAGLTPKTMAAISWIYARAFMSFMRDDTRDLSRTMAALDRLLQRSIFARRND